MLIRRSVVPAALFLALSAGCANNTGTSTEPGAPAPAPSSAAAVPESATTSAPAPSEPGAGKPSAGKGTTTLTGTITAGVEPGCMLLDGHLLIFDDAATKQSIKAGDQVTVVGTPAGDVMSTCQQGEPFRVSSVAGS
ncbi:hypothetical protein [Actinoplanes sp. DH11]|uniref:hypothetical protein n=1 Tax=Actinoplanes sp. DH11 TaxID=2857011 RepID=UPI001E4B4F5A|nr:hypothetical protein [Actinoplanes sp. DH11]